MATNPELEAAIEKDPDDEDAYFVYGDWLQTQDDPRGELIALQAAANRDPGDMEVTKRVVDLLGEHKDDWVVFEKKLKATWHLGFVRHVQIKTKEFDDALDALRALLEHPSGRFVRSIAFAQMKGIDPDRVVKLLLELKRPLTLSELRIGGKWDSADAPELTSVFTRLNRTLDLEWQRILARLSDQRALDTKFDVEKLPRLEPLPDVEAEVHPEQILFALKLEIDKRLDLGAVAAMKRSFTQDSIDRFVTTLGQHFIAASGPANMKWGWQAIGKLGGDYAANWLADHLGSWTHARAVQAAEMLGQIRSNLALWELYAMTMDPSINRPRREDATQILERVAVEKKTSVDRMLDRAVPSILPETRARWSTRKTAAFDQRSRVRDAAIRRLQDHMIDGRRIEHHDFIHYFVRHPAMASLTRRMLWATYEGVDVETTFRIDAEGKPLDASGDEVDLAGAMVGVLHPAELDAGDRRATLKEWKEVFDDDEIEELFPQLDRPVEELKPSDKGVTITRFKLRTVGFDHMRSIFEYTLDWAPDTEDTDGGAMTIGWSKYFPRDRVTALAGAEGGGIELVTATRNGKRVAFDTLHPVTVSEILYSVDRGTSRAKVEADVAESSDITKGTRVKIMKGANRLREGVVFWIGDGNNGPRVGLRNDDGETFWANVSDVKIDNNVSKPPVKARDNDAAADDDDEDSDDENDAAAEFIKKAKPALAKGSKAEAPAPEGGLAKGTKVNWTKGRHAGTGTVFWIGKNKFGDGMRAGVKDDETGETVWADADDCKPV